MNKVTEMNCSFFFKLGFSFVKKRTEKRTLRIKVPRYTCWLPRGWWIWVWLTTRTVLRLTLQLPTMHPAVLLQWDAHIYYPPSAISTPSPSAGYLGDQVRRFARAEENKLPLPSVRGGTPPRYTQENWRSPVLELTPLLQTGHELIWVRRENQ